MICQKITQELGCIIDIFHYRLERTWSAQDTSQTLLRLVEFRKRSTRTRAKSYASQLVRESSRTLDNSYAECIRMQHTNWHVYVVGMCTSLYVPVILCTSWSHTSWPTYMFSQKCFKIQLTLGVGLFTNANFWHR